MFAAIAASRASTLASLRNRSTDVEKRGRRTVEGELWERAAAYLALHSTKGRWESEAERERRTLDEIALARAVLKEGLA